jgi:hypothetical protein
MNRRSVELRLENLRFERADVAEKIKRAQDAGMGGADLANAMLKLSVLDGRVMEREEELEAEKTSPRYGDPIRVNGMWSTRVPLVGSVEEANKLLALRGTESPQRVWAGREFREKEATQSTVSAMDGRSPHIPPEERKPGSNTL